MKKLALHWQILIGMILGILFGIGMIFTDGGASFVGSWIKPIGTIFVKLLKLIAVPLIIASLIKGISDLKDISKFKNIGIRTMTIYIGTTVIAISIGLALVNIVKPGEGISEETITRLTETYANSGGVQAKIAEANKQQSSGPLQFLIDMVPDNAIKAMGSNKSMLQVIFFTIFLGISMLLIGEDRAKPLK
ncbi:dicarboxylate/amino acid:cation symporter, partial [Tenacibaculum piscium]